MKKLISIVLLASIFLTSCVYNGTVFDLKAESSETYGAKSEEISVESNAPASDGVRLSDIEFAFSCEPNRRVVTVGQTEATKLIITYTQTISEETVKCGDMFTVDVASESSVIKSYNKAFSENGIVMYGENNYEHSVTLEEYIEKFSITPLDDCFTGFELSDDADMEFENIGENEYRVSFSGNRHCEKMRKKMQIFGGLTSLPEFGKVEMTIKTDALHRPITVEITSEYRVVVVIIGEIDCVQNLTLTYTYDDISITNIEELESELTSFENSDGEK